MKKRVLFVDNDKDFLDTRGEALERAAFELYKATSLEAAEEILRSHWINLMIIDWRLRDENDDKDKSGLNLARRERYHSIPKIILTKYPTYQHVREALGPALDGLPPAVEFLAKQEGPEVMMAAVAKAFNDYVGINWALSIRCQFPLSFVKLADTVTLRAERPNLIARADELEGLFRHLFSNSQEIIISQVLALSEDRVALEVVAYSTENVESRFIVICGQRASVSADRERYQKFIQPTSLAPVTILAATGKTLHFAALVYRLAGRSANVVMSFNDFYSRHSENEITATLYHFFSASLEPLYEQGRFREEEKPLDDYLLALPGMSPAALDRNQLAERIENIVAATLRAGLSDLEHSPHRIMFPANGTTVSLPNPASVVAEISPLFAPPFLCGTMLGKLDGNSLVIDLREYTWLIDFSLVGRGPLLWDFVCLETAVKFDLLRLQDLAIRYEIEKRLAAQPNLSAMIDNTDLPPEAQKALHVIRHIRHHASLIISEDLLNYRGGLLIDALNRLAAYTPARRYLREEIVPYAHALLAAALLFEQVSPPLPQDLPQQALENLWLDEQNMEAWVEGRQISLTSQEFKLLQLLYQRKGQLCRYTLIAREVFEADFQADTEEWEQERIEKNRINTLVGRLRKKLETDPSNPKYIHTVHGQGYKLEIPAKGDD